MILKRQSHTQRKVSHVIQEAKPKPPPLPVPQLARAPARPQTQEIQGETPSVPEPAEIEPPSSTSTEQDADSPAVVSKAPVKHHPLPPLSRPSGKSAPEASDTISKAPSTEATGTTSRTVPAPRKPAEIAEIPAISRPAISRPIPAQPSSTDDAVDLKAERSAAAQMPQKPRTSADRLEAAVSSPDNDTKPREPIISKQALAAAPKPKPIPEPIHPPKRPNRPKSRAAPEEETVTSSDATNGSTPALEQPELTTPATQFAAPLPAAEIEAMLHQEETQVSSQADAISAAAEEAPAEDSAAEVEPQEEEPLAPLLRPVLRVPQPDGTDKVSFLPHPDISDTSALQKHLRPTP